MTSKRNVHSYKVTDEVYNAARKRAIKDKSPLATQIEEWITSYSTGLHIGVFDIKYGNSEITSLTKSTKAAKK